MALSRAVGGGTFPLIPQLSVLPSRRCANEEDVNCFASIKGCNSTNDENAFRCNDPAGWSVSLVFVGTGAELAWPSDCTAGSCMWSIEGIFCGGPRASPSPKGPMIYLEGLAGGDNAKHTLTVTSAKELEHNAALYIKHATIHTGLDTPVHAEDNIWIPANSSMLNYEGEWRDIGGRSSGVPPNSQMRELASGAGSVGMDVFADRFHFHHWIILPTPESDAATFPNWTKSVNGDLLEQLGTTGPFELTPEGRYNVTLHSAGRNSSLFSDDPILVAFTGLSYHPLSNVTRIRDITPPGLVEAVEEFDYEAVIGSDRICSNLVDESGGGSESRAASLRESFSTMGTALRVLTGCVALYALLCACIH